MKLSRSQLDTFEEQGYLHINDALGPADIDPVIWEYEGIVDRRARKLYAEGKTTSLHEREPFNRRILRIAEEAPEISYNLFPQHTLGRAVFQLICNPTILQIAESLVGPEILGHPTILLRPRMPDHVPSQFSYYVGKDAGGELLSWHQDSGVFDPEADDTVILTVWIALTEATEENGCLVVIPGSHKYGIRRHVPRPEKLDLMIPPEELPPGDVTPLPTTAGGLIVFNNYLCHGTLPNRSNNVRWSADFRYQDPTKPTGQPDVAGFIARSHEDPDKVLAYPEWVSLWERNRAAAESRSKPRVAPWRVRWGYVADQEAHASG